MAFVPKYIFILGFTIVIDFFAGIFLERIENGRLKKMFLLASLVANIGVLVFFKYFNFLNTNLDTLLHFFDVSSPFSALQILLPIGLSFHTFQAMSYTIEVYRGNQRAEKNFGIYALYVMFYPQLVAGPIERPQNILNQFHTSQKYSFNDLKSGLVLMAFGMFKKVVIADRLGSYVDPIFKSPQNFDGLTILVAVIFYSFQIYCDFSGYSDIGIGAARTMGYRLMINFNRPYLSRSVSEFWTRWHISLSTWFRDYLYIPLGGNRVAIPRWYFNIFIVFLISGFWHGANWTFVIWGGMHAVLLVAASVKDRVWSRMGWKVHELSLVSIIFTFLLVSSTWVVFRSPDLSTALIVYKKLFSITFADSIVAITSYSELIFSFLLIVFLLVKEQFWQEISTENSVRFYCVFISLIVVCYFFGVFTNNQFIYFQF